MKNFIYKIIRIIKCWTIVLMAGILFLGTGASGTARGIGRSQQGEVAEEEASTVSSTTEKEALETTEIPEETGQPEIMIENLKVLYKDTPEREVYCKKDEKVYYLNDTAILYFQLQEAFREKVAVFVKTIKDGRELVPVQEWQMGEKPESGEEQEDCFCVEYLEEGAYTVTVWGEDEKGDAGKTETIHFVIDKTAPVISDLCYANADGVIVPVYQTIYSSKDIRLQFQVEDMGVGVKEDGVFVSVKEERDHVFIAHREAGNRYYVMLPKDIEQPVLDDAVTIWANDCLGNESFVLSEHMKYSTDKPDIRMESSVDYSRWTNQAITFHITMEDIKSGLQRIVYRVNGKTVKKMEFFELVDSYDDILTVTDCAQKENGYLVEVEVTNHCGSVSKVKRRVYIDNVPPVVSLAGAGDGMHYNTDVKLTAEIEELSYRKTSVIYDITRVSAGQTDHMQTSPVYPEQCHDRISHVFTKEGFYKVCAVVTDGAGNTSRSDILSFVIDKTAPVLSISGVKNSSMNAKPVTILFRCQEEFFETNQVTIRTERMLDGKKAEENATNMVTARETEEMKRIFWKDGTYKVILSAVDKAGNIATSQTILFFVDATKPKIRITGTDNYEMWDGPATIRFSVTESYYTWNHVKITGTRRDVKGKQHKVELPAFSNYNKNSTMTQTFREDGVYEFRIVSKDRAGNKADSTIHFTIDQTAPVIYSIRDYADGVYEEFCLRQKLSGLFRDLTVISYRLLLNGIEYNGTDVVDAEGKYQLYVEARDELGHVARESIEFLIRHAGQEEVPDNQISGIVEEKTPLPESNAKAFQSGHPIWLKLNPGKSDSGEWLPAVFLLGVAVVFLLVCCLAGKRKRLRKGEDLDESSSI